MTQKSESHQFRFHFNQTLWATAIFLEKLGQDIHYLDLARMLYVVERNYLAVEGEMLMGGQIYALENGAVLKSAFRLIKGDDVRRSDEWARCIRVLPKTRHIRLIHFPENFRLWSHQRRYVYDVVERYYGNKKINLEKSVRSFPEWKKYKPTETERFRIIPWEEVLKARGREDLIESANNTFEIRRLIDEVIGKTRQ